MIAEHDRIVLLRDIPEVGLLAGDVGTVVHIYRDDRAYKVAFTTLRGDTAAVATLPAGAVRGVTGLDMTHARARTVA